jgi:lysophospholipase L1-like esterase
MLFIRKKSLYSFLKKLHSPPMKPILSLLAAVVVSLLPAFSLAGAGGLLWKSGEKVVFYGDEAMNEGGRVPGGYVKLVTAGAEELGAQIEPVLVRGGASREMLARLEGEVLGVKPTWVVLAVGFTDTWNKIPAEIFQKNVTAMVDTLQSAGVKVVLLTPLPLEPANHDFNAKLAPTVDFLRNLAREKQLVLADLYAEFLRALQSRPPGSEPNALTMSMNRPNPTGHFLAAQTILNALGAAPGALAKVEAGWMDAPGNATVTSGGSFAVRGTTLNLWQYDALKKVARERGQQLYDLFHVLHLESVLEALKEHGDLSYAPVDNISNEADPIFKRKVLALIADQPRTLPMTVPRAPGSVTNLAVKEGQKVVFMGDSITGLGWGDAGGYIRLVVAGLEALGTKITPLPAGIGGNRSLEMLARLEKDVLEPKPDWLLLSCGVNDVWSRSVDLPTFQKNITEIVDRAQAAGIRVMLLTPSPIYELNESEFSINLAGYVAFMSQLAKERNLPLADINAAWIAYCKTQPPKTNGNVTIDGVHPNPDGHLAFARTILVAWGATPEQMQTVEAAWLSGADNAAISLWENVNNDAFITLRQYEKLPKIAAERKTNTRNLINTLHMEALREVLEAIQAGRGFEKVRGFNVSKDVEPIFQKKVEEVVK